MSRTLTDPTTTAFSVNGMTCGWCESHVQKAVARLPGVDFVRAAHQSGRAVVGFDPSVTNAAAIGAAITAAGYPAEPVTSGSSDVRPAACGCGCR